MCTLFIVAGMFGKRFGRKKARTHTQTNPTKAIACDLSRAAAASPIDRTNIESYTHGWRYGWVCCAVRPCTRMRSGSRRLSLRLANNIQSGKYVIDFARSRARNRQRRTMREYVSNEHTHTLNTRM